MPNILYFSFLVGAAPQGVPEEVSSDGRAGLMAAIRNAGGKKGAKLKSAKERKQERKKDKEAAATAPSGGGGDLMSDLFSKLTMRRKGIQGSKSESKERTQQQNTDNMSPMDKISAMIPPPSKPDRSESRDSGDWDE